MTFRKIDKKIKKKFGEMIELFIFALPLEA
jgi:hypothetical protein